MPHDEPAPRASDNIAGLMDSPPAMREPGFPIVGIGASAGGIEALEGFFRGMPDKPGLAFIVVTHLSRGRESILHTVISHFTSMPVEVAADDMQVLPDRIYVMPANAVLTIKAGRLRLAEATQTERHPVDIFLSSLASDQGEAAIGIVLSGGDGDGTLGAKAIKEHGGLTLAQAADGFGPAQPSMPESAISSGVVDFALSVSEMGARLTALVRELHSSADQAGAVGPARERATLDGAAGEICTILRNQTRHEFSGYKSRTFHRRVRRRMQVAQLGDIADYVTQLRQNPGEVQALFRDLLINVTSFFRDADAFADLGRLIVPKLFEGKTVNDVVRVWVPGCSTGEEVYSVAILIREHLETLTERPRVQIFATDIDEQALLVARGGRYPTSLLEHVSEERRRRFFTIDGASSALTREVRDMCIFSPHSVLRDPPFSRIDLVSCRNLLIYFGLDAQNRTIPTFHYALRPGGYLFLGLSENAGQFADLFLPVEKKHRIFRARDDGAPTMRLPLMLTGPGRSSNVPDQGVRKPSNGAALRRTVEQQVLERFSPPHVVIDRDGNVIYYSARTGHYLEAAPGAPTRQIFALIRRELRLDLRHIFQRAAETGRSASTTGLLVGLDDGRQQVLTLTMDPFQEVAGEPLFLVLFQVAAAEPEAAGARSEPVAKETAVRTERELRDTRERLQSTIEEYETALEELKVSNEELTSVNEEMQSTNEEMEASKEELQSLNEEMQTVNAELHAKVEALDLANTDLSNLFESSNVATVFLDRRLTIRSFTPAVTRVFKILPGDRGRPITDLASLIPLPGFTDDVTTVLGGGAVIERHITPDNPSAISYLVRIAPYRDLEHRADGVVVTFLDVSGLARAEGRQRILIAELQHRTRNLLALVQAIATQTLGKGGSLDSFVDRLCALGRVQGLLSQATQDEVDLTDVVELELEAYAQRAGDRAGAGAGAGAGDGAADGGTRRRGSQVTITGSPVLLQRERVQTLALALHELATNAVKHGALRVPQGRLAISWQVEMRPDGRHLVLNWQESGVTMPAGARERRGYGRILIERALTFSLQAKTELTFEAGGIRCRIEMALQPPAGAAPRRLDN